MFLKREVIYATQVIIIVWEMTPGWMITYSVFALMSCYELNSVLYMTLIYRWHSSTQFYPWCSKHVNEANCVQINHMQTFFFSWTEHIWFVSRAQKRMLKGTNWRNVPFRNTYRTTTINIKGNRRCISLTLSLSIHISHLYRSFC